MTLHVIPPKMVQQMRRVRFCSHCGRKAAMLRWPFFNYYCPECKNTTSLPRNPTITVALCASCHRSYFWRARFCPNCGAPVEVSEEAGDGNSRLESEPTDDFPKQISASEIADILHTIETLPNLRSHPQEGDLDGDYDEWFDGGAVRHVTGYNEYEFHNGVRVWWHVLPYLSITIELANGESVHIKQAPLQSQKLRQPIASPVDFLGLHVKQALLEIQKRIVCPMCDGETSLFYFADGSFAHWGRPPQVPDDCPCIVGTCWGCDGEGVITPERQQELESYSQWRRRTHRSLAHQ